MDSNGEYPGSSGSDDPLANALPPQMRSDIDNIRADYHRFDYSRYPHPLPILGPLFGFHEARTRKMVAAEWAWARRTLQRPLNDGEEDALAGAACSQIRTMSYAGPIGTMAGLYRAYATRETWRLPFWAMGERFDPDIVKLGAREVMTGQTARTFWTVLRNGLYGANGVVFSMCIFASLSASSISKVIMRDPRLQEFSEAIKQTAAQSREERVRRASRLPETRQIPRPRIDPTGQGPRSTGELWKNHRTSIEGQAYDQNSPSDGQGVSGNDMIPDPLPSSNFPQENNASSSSRPAWQRQGQPPSRRPPPIEPKADGGFIDDWDDASPVAGPPSSPSRQTSQGSGSAWERVRRDAADESRDSPTARDPSAPRGERGANTGYTFSDKDEDRQLARSEAQKEFDARIERERQGGDFSEGRGQRKW